MNFTDDHTNTHFVPGQSPTDEIPTQWIVQYLHNFSMGKKDDCSVACRIMGMSHTGVMELAQARGLI